MQQVARPPLFPLGEILVTEEVQRLVSGAEIRRALARHGYGDWGCVDRDTKAENDGGIGYARLSICSRYSAGSGQYIWVMTLPERHRTVVTLGTLNETTSYT